METDSHSELEVRGNSACVLTKGKVKRDHTEVLQGDLLLSKTSPKEFSCLVQAELSGGSNLSAPILSHQL